MAVDPSYFGLTAFVFPAPPVGYFGLTAFVFPIPPAPAAAVPVVVDAPAFDYRVVDAPRFAQVVVDAAAFDYLVVDRDNIGS